MTRKKGSSKRKKYGGKKSERQRKRSGRKKKGAAEKKRAAGKINIKKGEKRHLSLTKKKRRNIFLFKSAVLANG